MKITQIPMGAHNAQLTCYLQDPCTEMPALDRCPAILIFPGGAYAFCSDREADPVALAFLNAGYNAFVLRYSVSQNCPVEEVYTNAFAEAQEAMDYLHQNAGDLHIDPEQIAVVGFSAGGHLAASVGTMGRVRPAAMLLGYAVFSVPGKALGMELPDLLQQVDDQTPPTFLLPLRATIWCPPRSPCSLPPCWQSGRSPMRCISLLTATTASPPAAATLPIPKTRKTRNPQCGRVWHSAS